MRRAAGLGLLLLVAACAAMPTVPAVPPWNEVSGDAPIDDGERALWDQAKDERVDFEEEQLLVPDATLTAYLERVTASLLPPLPAQAPRPAVHVVRSHRRLAGSFADGGMFITTSMLSGIANEAQLAALLGHELGHFMARHLWIRKQFAKSSRSTVERMQLSREHEYFSDRYALEAMRRAGYDPREAAAMLQLAEPEDAPEPGLEVFRTHPFMNERVQSLNATIALTPPPDPARTGKDEYEQAIAGVLPIAAEVELRAGSLARARDSIARLQALRPDSGRGYFLKGEHARLTERDGRRSAPARSAYERAVVLAPQDPEVVRTLGLLYHEDGNLARATPLLEKYLRLAPDAADRRLVERYLGRAAP